MWCSVDFRKLNPESVANRCIPYYCSLVTASKKEQSIEYVVYFSSLSK
jgi:hypothetical protein